MRGGPPPPSFGQWPKENIFFPGGVPLSLHTPFGLIWAPRALGSINISCLCSNIYWMFPRIFYFFRIWDITLCLNHWWYKSFNELHLWHGFALKFKLKLLIWSLFSTVFGKHSFVKNKLDRCNTYLRNLKTLPTDRVGARRWYCI